MNRLKTVRQNSGLKQKEVASALGISRGTLWCYEKGERKLSFDMAVKLAKIYGCSVEDFIEKE